MNLPSVKTLAAITDQPKLLREILETTSRAKLEEMMEREEFRSARFWYRSCYHQPPLQVVKLNMADCICRTHGVELARGIGASPSFEFLNTGDPYDATLLWIRGRYRVACWGDIVERGRYV